MNRRSFLKCLVVGTVGLAIPSTLFQSRDINVPIRWVSREQVAEKYALVQKLMENAIESHDRMIEEAIFSGSFSEQAAWERIL